jgi:hypothetical protein
MPPTPNPATETEGRAMEAAGRPLRGRAPAPAAERGKGAAIAPGMGARGGTPQTQDLLDAVSEGERAFAEGRSGAHDDVKARLSGRWA